MYHLTPEGYEEFSRELDELLSVKRPALVKRLKEALQLGDLRENFDYHDAKRQQGMLEARVRDLKAILEQSTVVEAAAGGVVGMGSRVTLKDTSDGFEEEFVLVSPPEANPSNGKISHESDVGSALLGCKAGDIVSVKSPGGEFQYEIISVQ